MNQQAIIKARVDARVRAQGHILVEEAKDIDINSIDFSLNNEKILNEVNKILKLDKYDNLTSLEIF